jgi:hypothetical protein
VSPAERPSRCKSFWIFELNPYLNGTLGLCTGKQLVIFKSSTAVPNAVSTVTVNCCLAAVVEGFCIVTITVKHRYKIPFFALFRFFHSPSFDRGCKIFMRRVFLALSCTLIFLDF